VEIPLVDEGNGAMGNGRYLCMLSPCLTNYGASRRWNDGRSLRGTNVTSYLSRADANEPTVSLTAKEGQSTRMTSGWETLGMCNHCQWLFLVEFGRWSRGGGVHLLSLISTTLSQLPKGRLVHRTQRQLCVPCPPHACLFEHRCVA
jgi:hypothetical protein